MRDNGGTFTNQHQLFANLRKRILINAAETHTAAKVRRDIVLHWAWHN